MTGYQCKDCPRNCGIIRDSDEKKTKGYCMAPDLPKVARAALHFWEEPCISGEEGSGTVFFSGCNLRCVYCQNAEIANGTAGREISVERLAEIFLELQEKGANNINLVTPSHYYRQIKEALLLVKEKLQIPVIANTSSYDSVIQLKEMEGLIDIYLADYKYADADLAKKYSHAKDYPEVASRALKEMFRQVGEPVFDEEGRMKQGMIVRHLLLPGQKEDSKKVLRFLYDTFGDSIFISIMNQYTPLVREDDYPELKRKITEEEYEEVVEYAISLGIENGFIQEGETAEESFIPAFDGEGV
ncbi:MAG: radical SAM protein [Lachnospiraceae bacterium]|nr:radical SAM protein [Lachnospiraceae bacterium]